MTINKTWKLAQGGVKECIWCYREASLCTIEDPCNGRKRWERETVYHLFGGKIDRGLVAAYIEHKRPISLNPRYAWATLRRRIMDDYGRQHFHLDTALWSAEDSLEAVLTRGKGDQ